MAALLLRQRDKNARNQTLANEEQVSGFRMSFLPFWDWGCSQRWRMIPVQLLEGGAAWEGAERVDPKSEAPSTVCREGNYRAVRATAAQTHKSADKGKHGDGGKKN